MERRGKGDEKGRGERREKIEGRGEKMKMR